MEALPRTVPTAAVRDGRRLRDSRLSEGQTMTFWAGDAGPAIPKLLYLTFRGGSKDDDGSNDGVVRHCCCGCRRRRRYRDRRRTRAPTTTTVMVYSHRSVQMGARVTIEWYHPKRVISARLTVANSEKLTRRENLNRNDRRFIIKHNVENTKWRRLWYWNLHSTHFCVVPLARHAYNLGQSATRSAGTPGDFGWEFSHRRRPVLLLLLLFLFPDRTVRGSRYAFLSRFILFTTIIDGSCLVPTRRKVGFLCFRQSDIMRKYRVLMVRARVSSSPPRRPNPNHLAVVFVWNTLSVRRRRCCMVCSACAQTFSNSIKYNVSSDRANGFSVILHARPFVSGSARIKAAGNCRDASGLCRRVVVGWGRIINAENGRNKPENVIVAAENRTRVVETRARSGGRRGVVKMTLTRGRRRRPPLRPHHPLHPPAVHPPWSHRSPSHQA